MTVIVITPLRAHATCPAVIASGISSHMNDETSFFPRGAIAFFVSMVVFYAAVWLLLAAIMVSRG